MVLVIVAGLKSLFDDVCGIGLERNRPVRGGFEFRVFGIGHGSHLLETGTVQR